MDQDFLSFITCPGSSFFFAALAQPNSTSECFTISLLRFAPVSQLSGIDRYILAPLALRAISRFLLAFDFTEAKDFEAHLQDFSSEE